MEGQSLFAFQRARCATGQRTWKPGRLLVFEAQRRTLESSYASGNHLILNPAEASESDREEPRIVAMSVRLMDTADEIRDRSNGILLLTVGCEQLGDAVLGPKSVADRLTEPMEDTTHA